MTDDPLASLAELAAAVLDDYRPAEDLRPVVEAVLAEAAAERWINKQLDETSIRSMDFRNGVEMDIAPARELLAHWVAAARTMLGDAKNYTETRLEFDVKVAESPELYTLVIQRHGPGVLTPHEARQEAEARAVAAEARIQAVTEATVMWRDRPGGDIGLAIALAGILDTEKPEPPASAALVRVLGECDRIEREVYGQHDEDDDGMREAVRRIRAAATEPLTRAGIDGAGVTA
ncbi:MAG: hypothetical protein JWO67_1901 [Streptosporangiaceae bacterium]|nr:hypothetical protein [Streptosporangiaceae bacterium]